MGSAPLLRPKTHPGWPIAGCALLAWVVGATLLSWCVAANNFRITDPAHDPDLRQIFAPIEGDEAQRMAMRYVASESNRAMFRWLGPAQLAATLLGAGCLWWGIRGVPGTRGRWSRRLLPMVVIAAGFTAAMVDPIIRLGREIDFVSRIEGDPPQKQKFDQIHAVYMSADLLKVLVASSLIVLFVRTGAVSTRESGNGLGSVSPSPSLPTE